VRIIAKCRHINADTSHDICEKCGLNLPDTLFHECHRCLKKLRLDTEICPGCGFHIMAYCVLEDRWARLQKLKDEDQVEALELLEVMLREGPGEHEDDALGLVKDLRKKQSQISGLIAEADKATAKGDLEDAIRAWRAVINVIPRHRMAQEHVETLQSTLQDFTDHLRVAKTLMDEGQFESADGHLQKCLELIPKREKVRSALNVCRQRAREYTTALGQARECAGQKLLLKARQYAEAALAQATNNPEARTLVDALAGTLKKTKGFADQARLQIPRAEFAKAHENVDSIVHLQADNESVSALKADLDKIQNAYLASMKNAQTARTDHKLDKAADAAKNALALCPESPQARSLLKEITVDQDQELEALMVKFKSLSSEATTLMDQARFQDADTQLQNCLELVPQREEIRTMLEICRQRSRSYSEAMKKAVDAKRQKNLLKASMYLERALSQASKSFEAAALASEVSQTITRVRQLTNDAHAQLEQARFSEVTSIIAEMEDLQADDKTLPKLKTQSAKIMATYMASIEAARVAWNEHDLTKALAEAEESLNLCTNSPEAQTMVKQLKAEHAHVDTLLKNAAAATRAAKFDEAGLMLAEAEQLWPTKKGLDEAKKTRWQAGATYEQHMQHCRHAKKETDLGQALDAVKSAFTVCPNSEEVSAMAEAIEKDQFKAREHLKNAKNALKEASFEAARENVRNAGRLWTTLQGRKEIEAEIASVSQEFASLMSVAANALRRGRFYEASFACRQALQLCPDAAEAKTLESEIEYTERRHEEHRKHSKEVALSTGKLTACVIAAVAVLVLLVILAIGFWKWVTGTVCPWFVAHQGSLIVLCLIISGITTLVHSFRNTDSWIKMRGGTFFIPVFFAGVFVLVSVLLAIFAFHAPWRSGSAVGLALGVAQSGFWLFFSFIDD